MSARTGAQSRGRCLRKGAAPHSWGVARRPEHVAGDGTHAGRTYGERHRRFTERKEGTCFRGLVYIHSFNK